MGSSEFNLRSIAKLGMSTPLMPLSLLSPFLKEYFKQPEAHSKPTEERKSQSESILFTYMI
jgi:hypothetical protein